MLELVRNLPGNIVFRWRTALATFACLFTCSFLALSQFSGPQYRSEAWLLLAPTPLVAPLAPGWSNNKPIADLEIAERQLLSSPTLLRVGRQYAPFSDFTEEQLVSVMRAALTTRRVQGSGRANLLQIVVSGSDRETTFAIARDLAAEVINQDLSRQKARAAEAETLALATVEATSNTLATLDDTIGKFRAEHIDALPETLESRFALLTSIDTQIRSLAQDRLALMRLSTEVTAGQRPSTELSLAGQVQLRLDRARLDLQRAESLDQNGSPAAQLLTQRITELERQLDELNEFRGMTALDAELIELSRQKENLEKQRADIHASIAATPLNASLLEPSRRELENVTRQAASAQDALETIRSWRSALEQGVITRWQVVDAPTMPDRPTGIAIWIAVLAALMTSAAGAVGAVLARTMMDPRLQNATMVSAMTGSPPIAVFPRSARLSPRLATADGAPS